MFGSDLFAEVVVGDEASWKSAVRLFLRRHSLQEFDARILSSLE